VKTEIPNSKEILLAVNEIAKLSVKPETKPKIAAFQNEENPIPSTTTRALIDALNPITF